MRAVVTGANQGIGRSIANRLTSDGYDVVSVDVQNGADFRCDISDEQSVAALADAVGPVDVLVNNAGVWHYSSLLDAPTAELERTMRVNFMGAVNCTRAFGRPMVAQGSGNIVNVTSIAAVNPSPRVGLYSSSTAGLVALTRQTALDWGPHGVRCNAVGPGMVLTESVNADAAEAAARRASAVPLRRLGRPEDVANVVAFLVSYQAAYVSGQVIYVDGALSQALFGLLP